MKQNLVKLALFMVAVAPLAMIGCGEGNVGGKMLNKGLDSNIQRCRSVYGLYIARHSMQGPKDEAEFKEFLNGLDADRLSVINVDPNNRESILVSERDGEPFKIRWGVSDRARGPLKPIIFEATGVDGKYLVAFTGGEPREVDKAEYDKLWAGEKDDEGGEDRPGGTSR